MARRGVRRSGLASSPRACIAVVFGATVLLLAGAAAAHPAGFTSVNRYIGVACDGRGHLRVDYLLDFAELPSYTEFQQLDADHDGVVTPDEQRAYLERRLPPLVAAWTVEVNGAPASLRVTGSNLEAVEGERGMPTLRIAAEIDAERTVPLDPDVREIHVYLRDPDFSERSGWRELAAQDSADARVTAGFKESSSAALSYSRSASPPRQDEARLAFRLAPSSSEAAAGPRFTRSPIVVDERLARLSSALRRAAAAGPFPLLAVALAALLGAVHALSPGHGKALAAAYLVGRRARPWQALVFGTTVSVAHTVVVFGLAGLAVAIEHTIGTDRVMRGLEIVAAVTVLVLGLLQLPRRWKEVTTEGAGHGHVGAPECAGAAASIAALGASSGLTPCPSAVAVLLTAIALHRCGLGLVLVLAFSIGVATTLTGAGLLVLAARRVLDRVSRAATVVRWLPVVSSACVLLIGVFLCASALAQ
ncbi:MAG TPA: sulfite exporter TauE/SafE family protein [Polyangiaceae bacterium]|nr:sulfite exporter TauE/SafE family protein [Polyangiaceae bacterium]